MVETLTVGMKSWIEEDYRDICESPEAYGITELTKESAKVIDIIEEDINAKFELEIPRALIEEYLREND